MQKTSTVAFETQFLNKKGVGKMIDDVKMLQISLLVYLVKTNKRIGYLYESCSTFFPRKGQIIMR